LIPTLTHAEIEAEKLNLICQALKSGSVVRLQAHGLSMLPTIWPHDILTIQGAHRGGLSVGDIVMYRKDNRCFVHRIVKPMPDFEVAAEDAWVTQGDSNSQPDSPPVAASQLHGIVVGVQRYQRSIILPAQLVGLRRCAAWLLGRSARLRSLALRLHVFFHRRSLQPTFDVRARACPENASDFHIPRLS
jgi:hypothetical protein